MQNPPRVTLYTLFLWYFCQLKKNHFSLNFKALGLNFFIQALHISDGSESNFFNPGRVRSAVFGLGLALENFP